MVTAGPGLCSPELTTCARLSSRTSLPQADPPSNQICQEVPLPASGTPG